MKQVTRETTGNSLFHGLNFRIITVFFLSVFLYEAAFSHRVIARAPVQDSGQLQSDYGKAEPEKRHYFHMFDGKPKYPASFQHWDYVNPDAPVGGTVTLARRSPFDSLNHMNGKGIPAPGLSGLYNSLLTVNQPLFSKYGVDEIDAYYGELAEWIQVAQDRSWVVFKIRDEAKWADGVPVTPEDVIFTWEKNRQEGFEGFTQVNVDVIKIEDLGENRVKFTFNPDADNQQRPVVVGSQEIIPKHYWKDRDFGKTTQEIPLGSGPFRISRFKPGQYIEYERRDDYWALDLPFSRGLFNMKKVRYDIYREIEVIRNAFKAGKIDLRLENKAKAWMTSYEDMKPEIKVGVLHKVSKKKEGPFPAQAFFFNVQREKFKNRDVRHAIALAFDFEWSNKTIFFKQYQRLQSHFQGSPLQAKGKPEGLELEILEKFRGQIPDEVFGEVYSYPKTDGSGNNRRNLQKALNLFKKAGFRLIDGKLVDEGGEQFAFEYIYPTPSSAGFIIPWMENLQKIGVDARARNLEPNQWFEIVREREFDLTSYIYTYGYIPGTQVDYSWSSRLARTKGSIAFHGVENPVLDALAAELIRAPDRETLNATARALDRILTHEHYLVLEWFQPATNLLYWDKFRQPETEPALSPWLFASWWIDPQKAASLDQRRQDSKSE